MTTLLKSNPWTECIKTTMLLALPVLGAHLIEAIIPFFNIMLAASLGENALAAAGLVGSTFLALMGFCWGVTASVGIITANKIGENLAPSKIGLILWAGFLTTILLSLPVMFIFANMAKVWLWLGQDPAVVNQAHLYMNGLLMAVPADLAKFAIFQFAIACGKPRVPLLANIVSVPLLIGINTYLIPIYGIYGIGLGTAITYTIIFLAMLGYLFITPFFNQYLRHTYSLPDFIQTTKHQLQLGIPIGLMFSIELIFFMVFALLMGKLGVLSLAANQIAMQWMWLTVMIVYGFTEAVTILVAKANGANKPQDMIQFTITGVSLASISTLLVALVYWFAPNLIIGVDISQGNENPELISLAVKLLMFCGIYQILDAVRIVISGALRGMEDSKYPLYVNTFAFWGIGLPIAYSCAFIFNLQETGLWIGLLSATIMSNFLQYYRMKSKMQPYSDSVPALNNTKAV